MKPTPTECIDGKNHRWKFVCYSGCNYDNTRLYWCSMCGSLTEKRNGKRLWENMLEKKKGYNAQIPSGAK